MIMLQTHQTTEDQRQTLQSHLDAQKTQAERNRCGQFATPSDLADDIFRFALKQFPKSCAIRFLDPAVGTGSFFSALRRFFPEKRIVEALGFEIDPHYGKPAMDLWSGSGFTVRLADFTRENPATQFNLVVCNPPYVRHHHLQNGDKTHLQFQTYRASGMKLSGLAGLYCYFLGLSHPWMADGGIAGWLIPSEFMDVNYGEAVKHYLLEKVTLLQIHRFDPNEVQFSDALVSSSVIWFKKSPPPKDHTVLFTFGGKLTEPGLSREIAAKVLARETKWTRFPAAGARQRVTVPVLSDFFKIKRGLATGDNKFFILDGEQISERGLPKKLFRPILPSPRHFSENEIRADDKGLPQIERQLFLLDTRISEDEARNRYPRLYAYFQEGKCRGVHERYICRHRTPWYSQEDRPAAPIVCTYIGRGDTKSGRPFRFILNHSEATAANVYLAMYPLPWLARAIERDSTLIRRIWEALNQIGSDQLLGEGRVYGGGLHKIEPCELARVDATTIADLVPGYATTRSVDQPELFEKSASYRSSTRKNREHRVLEVQKSRKSK
jgi:hypothetical protein